MFFRFQKKDFFDEPVLENDLLVIGAVDVRGPLRCRRQYAVHRSDPEPAVNPAQHINPGL